MTSRKPSDYDKMLAIDEIKRNAPLIVELEIEMAKLRKKAFDEHVKAGFSEDQALQIVKELFI